MSYRDHHTLAYDPWSGKNIWQVSHSWALDARQRLAWLYGDADERIAANGADVAAWRALGRRRALNIQEHSASIHRRASSCAEVQIAAPRTPVP